MNTTTLILRSLRHHARSHVGTLVGAVVGSGILTGALLVGDSVRGTLRDMALARLGSTTAAIASGDRFFRAALARELESSLATNALAVPALQLDAVATGADDSARANGVKLLGVDERFWRLGLTAPSFPSPGPDEVLLNERLARQLKAKAGDAVLLRVSKPSAFSREAPLTPQENTSLALRLTVVGVVPDAMMGRFSLQPSQVPPFNAFVHLGTLQTRLQLPGKVNQLLVTGASATQAQSALVHHWQLADAELELRPVPGRPELELRSPRVFLDPDTSRIARGLSPQAQGIVTYFVNELRMGEQATPYSMVTAAGPPWVPSGLGSNDIVINQWLASDLQARVGDELELRYFAVGTARRLDERTARFRVGAIVPLEGAAADPSLMPEFPGIEHAESTRDWDSTLPISPGRIREQDEQYWKQHRGTPKAFIPLATGEALWTNRFGVLTGVRFPAGANREDARAALATALLHRLAPESFGLRFQSVRESALAAAAQSQDFGGLFIGFSFFLITAALLLMALLFRFGLEQRATEIGTLLALGFTPRRVRWLLLGEGSALALIGGVLGTLGGIAYARWMIHGLATSWVDAVGTSALDFHAAPTTLLGGGLAGAGVACVTLWLTLRRQASLPARVLLAGESDTVKPLARRTARGPAWLAAGAGLGAAALAGQAIARGDTASAGVFFGAGALLLLAGMAACNAGLRRLTSTGSTDLPSLTALAARGAARRRGRSLSTVGLLASGSFLIAAIGVFQLDAVRDAERRDSGTGGFAFVGSSTFPVVQDVNTEAGRAFYALDAGDLPGVSVVGGRVRDGDEASCLNLNRAQQPRLVGINPQALAERGAFTFAKAPGDAAGRSPWLALTNWNHGDAGLDEVPAIGDLNSILWAMGRKVGDALTYRDERGREFRVRLVGAVANSILQGNLLIDEAAFVRLFPAEPGYRLFLVDAPASARDRVSSVLTRTLRDAGLELTPAAQQLAAFNAVQNTYLGTFQLLGGLGLVLGSAGLGIVVLRNVLERRGELALLQAVGFGRGRLRQLVLLEHAALLAAGLAVGAVAAAVAVMPTLLTPGTTVPWRTLAPLLGGAVAVGFLCAWAATRLALRGDLLGALRNE